MAWRVPRFGVRHLLRDIGAASVSSENTIGTGDYLGFFFDERRELVNFAASESDHHIQGDLGTGYADLPVDRIVVPVGHNFNGHNLRVHEDNDPGFPSPAQLVNQAISSDAQIDLSLTESQERYVRIDWPSWTGNPECGELWLTLTLAPDESAEPTWRDERFYNVQTFVTPAGDRGDLQLGASQRIFELTYPKIYTAANIAMLDQLVNDVGMEQAFLFDPPFDDETALICKMLRPPERTFSHPVPASGSKGYTYRFYFQEQLV